MNDNKQPNKIKTDEKESVFSNIITVNKVTILPKSYERFEKKKIITGFW